MTRDNELLDEFMSLEQSPTKKRRKRRTIKIKRDAIKRRAFRVLAVIADLDEPIRRRVLRMAEDLSSFKKGKGDERS